MLKTQIKNVNILIFFSSYSKSSLFISSQKLKSFFKKLLIKFYSVSIPLKKKKITLLRSPHVHKKSKEQFEKIIYKKLIVVSQKIPLNLIKFFLSGFSNNVEISIKFKDKNKLIKKFE